MLSMVYPNDDGYFQQDDESCISTGIVQDWFEENEGGYLVWMV